MATYGTHTRDVNGNIASMMTFEATNHLVAIAQAMQSVDGCDLEVWHEAQRVGIIQCQGVEESGATCEHRW